MAQKLRRSSIFIIRTWTEDTGEGLAELRGMVRNAQNGETRYFHCWKDLIAFMDARVDAQQRGDCQP
jgi:hypothetical protein